MARRRARTRTVTRYVRARSRRAPAMIRRSRGKSRRSTGGAGVGLRDVIPHFVYGMARNKVAGVVLPYTSKVYAGKYADNVGLGIAAFAVGKLMPSAKKYTNEVLKIEAYDAGRKTDISGVLSSTTSTQSSISGMTIYG